jgi:hypothetical protein
MCVFECVYMCVFCVCACVIYKSEKGGNVSSRWSVASLKKIIRCVLSLIACYEAGNMVNMNRFALLDAYVAPYCCKNY